MLLIPGSLNTNMAPLSKLGAAFYAFWPFPCPSTKFYLNPFSTNPNQVNSSRGQTHDHHIITFPPDSLYEFCIGPGALLFLTRLTSALWVSVYQSVSCSVYIHIENLLFLLFSFSNHPEIKDNGSVLPGRRWANSQLAGHQFGRLPSSVLPGDKWCFICGFVHFRFFL